MANYAPSRVAKGCMLCGDFVEVWCNVTALDDSAYSARILDERNPGDRHEIKRLRSVAGVVERDLYTVQLAELAGLRGVGDMELSEPPRWVYYPWRTALARVLGPNGYRRLRLDRNR